MYWDTFTDIWILLHTCCTTLSFVGYHGVKTYRGRWAMRETHRRSICKPKNCDFSYWHKDSPVVISSFAVFRPLWWCPNRDPFLRRRACQPPNFSRAIEECKIGLPVMKNVSQLRIFSFNTKKNSWEYLSVIFKYSKDISFAVWKACVFRIQKHLYVSYCLETQGQSPTTRDALWRWQICAWTPKTRASSREESSICCSKNC